MPPPRFFERADLPPPELAFAPLDFAEVDVVLVEPPPPLLRAQRAFAAAASFARVAADIGRLRPSVFVAADDDDAPEELLDDAVLLAPPPPPPLKSELSRSSRD
jgi:hypothetical protein